MSGTGSAIIFSGGVGHPFAETSRVLAGLANEIGWSAHIETELEALVPELPVTDLLVVNALYWSMTQDEKYAPLRKQWACHLSDDQMNALNQFVHSGGRLLVVHTGVICWDTQPQWQLITGGGWAWGRSHHPPYGPIEVTLTATGQQISDGPAEFRLIDEAYHELSPQPDCTVLAQCDLGHGPQPLAWLRRYGEGKVAVDALGHDVRSLEQAGHRALIYGQLNWLCER